jgi:cyclopropane fatty-acyl-phospholipid synthase-like methyltransferase
MNTREHRWLQYWNERHSPEHRSDTQEFYRFHSAEIRTILDRRSFNSVLELGCGNGALYGHLGFQDKRYVGVDFSAAMLDDFRRTHPAVVLHNGDASAYSDGHKYDLIFSNGTVQYFDRRMMESHLKNARAMMHEDSFLVCGSIPWRRNRFAFYSGALRPPYEGSALNGLRAVAARTIRRYDNLGHWYDLRELAAIGRRGGLIADFYASTAYLYRFHALFHVAR